jgi:hypothetical protein
VLSEGCRIPTALGETHRDCRAGNRPTQEVGDSYAVLRARQPNGYVPVMLMAGTETTISRISAAGGALATMSGRWPGMGLPGAPG